MRGGNIDEQNSNVQLLLASNTERKRTHTDERCRKNVFTLLVEIVFCTNMYIYTQLVSLFTVSNQETQIKQLQMTTANVVLKYGDIFPLMCSFLSSVQGFDSTAFRSKLDYWSFPNTAFLYMHALCCSMGKMCLTMNLVVFNLKSCANSVRAFWYKTWETYRWISVHYEDKSYLYLVIMSIMFLFRFLSCCVDFLSFKLSAILLFPILSSCFLSSPLLKLVLHRR